MLARESGERERRTRATLVPRRFTPPDRVSFATLTFPDVSLCFDEKMFHLDKLVAVDRSGPFSPQRWSRCRCRILGWLFVTCEHQYKMQKIYNFQIKWFVPVYEEDKDCRPEGDVKGNHCQGEDIVHR